jgi:hypothetical protein
MQLNFSGVSELLSAFYLTWPVLLAMLLLPTWRWVMALAIASGPFLLLLHPLAFVFCFGLGLLAWSLAWSPTWSPNWSQTGRRSEPIATAPPRAWRHIALWLGANGLARLLWTTLGLNDYERGRLNPSSAVNYMLTETIAQHVLVALLILTTLLALWTLRRDPDPSGRAPMLVATLWLTLLTAVWVSGEYILGIGIVLKSAITVGVGVLGMLCVSLMLLGQDGARARAGGRGSAMAIRLAGAALLTMLLAKSSAWHTGVRGLQDIVASSDSACIRFAADAPYSLQWPWMAITDAWSAPVTALVTRPFVPDADGSGFQPVAMLLKGDGCEVLQATGEARLPADTQISFERLDAAFGPLRPPRRLPR